MWASLPSLSVQFFSLCALPAQGMRVHTPHTRSKLLSSAWVTNLAFRFLLSYPNFLISACIVSFCCRFLLLSAFLLHAFSRTSVPILIIYSPIPNFENIYIVLEKVPTVIIASFQANSGLYQRNERAVSRIIQPKATAQKLDLCPYAIVLFGVWQKQPIVFWFMCALAVLACVFSACSVHMIMLSALVHYL